MTSDDWTVLVDKVIAWVGIAGCLALAASCAAGAFA